MQRIFAAFLALVLLVAVVASVPLDEEENALPDQEDLMALETYLQNIDKRSCMTRGRCSYSRNDCCRGYICKCNLFKQNCKCERKGIFGWGK
ncbi:PREDICTED: omega-agatoxin-Aa4b-like [Priapulus caudatus]|uniref:Omega-agatoxin-Aa4b-like n=1 Tax=Priapulus caudatus TaxID=37621 RepID=A0ABM1F308_PRICU|nr:PREDICTED: omega-agatoxin-Aa4b-like [Priapulus caudatus]XP_014678829.1 PREDICTED: omega-agatoxin-Aa4b-like [Priapulus caudatus]